MYMLSLMHTPSNKVLPWFVVIWWIIIYNIRWHKVLKVRFKWIQNLNFEAIYGLFPPCHSLYLHSVSISLHSSFIGSILPFKLPSHVQRIHRKWWGHVSQCNFISDTSLTFTVHPLYTVPEIYFIYIKLLLKQTENVILLLLHNKSVQLAKHSMAFIVTQPQERQCVCHHTKVVQEGTAYILHTYTLTTIICVQSNCITANIAISLFNK